MDEYFAPTGKDVIKYDDIDNEWLDFEQIGLYFIHMSDIYMSIISNIVNGQITCIMSDIYMSIISNIVNRLIICIMSNL